MKCNELNGMVLDGLNRLIIQSKIRGTHAFGLAWYSGGKVRSWKGHDLPSNLPHSERIIFHSRYSTSGDYQKHENNQPITLEQQALVFNGVIDMGTKQEMELKHGVKLQSDNDGEIILRKGVQDLVDFQEVVSGLNCSFAGLLLSGGKLIALRNDFRPLYRAFYHGATFYASTADIIKRALGECRLEQLEPNVAYAV